MKKIQFDQLPQGGFAGLREKQFVKDRRVFAGRHSNLAFDGIGNFVYLADANFNPKGETGMHPHREIDVISVMVAGRISHAGSMEHGQQLDAGFTQVQRAGAEGFSHNEINPDESQNQMIQLWVLPDRAGEHAGYKVYEPQLNQLQRVYGGEENQTETFYSKTLIDVANAEPDQHFEHQGEAMLYLSKGNVNINGEEIQERTLVKSSEGLAIHTQSDSQFIIVHKSHS